MKLRHLRLLPVLAIWGTSFVVAAAAPQDGTAQDWMRTWPVNGKFSARQAELYDAVLDAQKAGIAAAVPGATLREVNQACTDVMTERGFKKLMWHGAVHYVGMEVHDVGDGGIPIEPGVAFTIEPGLYEKETGIGIRIEDVVVITADGCEVVTADAPKERAAIEALIAERGVLELVDDAPSPSAASGGSVSR